MGPTESEACEIISVFEHGACAYVSVALLLRSIPVNGFGRDGACDNDAVVIGAGGAEDWITGTAFGACCWLESHSWDMSTERSPRFPPFTTCSAGRLSTMLVHKDSPSNDKCKSLLFLCARASFASSSSCKAVFVFFNSATSALRTHAVMRGEGV